MEAGRMARRVEAGWGHAGVLKLTLYSSLLGVFLMLLLVARAARLIALPIPTPTLPGAMASGDRKPHATFGTVCAFASTLAIHLCALFLLRVRGVAALVLWSTTTAVLVTGSTLKRNGTDGDNGELLAAGILSGLMFIVTLITLLFPSLGEKMVVVAVDPVP